MAVGVGPILVPKETPQLLLRLGLELPKAGPSWVGGPGVQAVANPGGLRTCLSGI